MKKQYLVNTSGKVVTQQNQSYLIKATSEAEAQEIAKNSFCTEFESADACVNVSYTKTIKQNWLLFLSYAFMIIAIAIAFCWSGTKEGFLFLPDKKIDIVPSTTSCMFAITIYVAFMVKTKGFKFFENIYDVVSCILLVLLLSTVVELMLTNENLKFLFIPIPFTSAQNILIFGIIFLICGMKLVSVACLLAVCLMGMSNLNMFSDAMGVWGIIYTISTFVGIALYISSDIIIVENMPVFLSAVSKGAKHLQSDAIEAKGSAWRIAKKTKKYIVEEKDHE